MAFDAWRKLGLNSFEIIFNTATRTGREPQSSEAELVKIEKGTHWGTGLNVVYTLY